MHRKLKILSNAYEFMKLYPHLSKKRLCEYFKISDRTLRRYKSLLGLPKKAVESTTASITNPILVDVCYGSSPYKTMYFVSFDELNAWIHAQEHVSTVYVNDDEGTLRMHIRVRTDWPIKADVQQVKDQIYQLLNKV